MLHSAIADPVKFVSIIPVELNLFFYSSNQQGGMPFINPKKKQKKKNYVNSGVLYLTACDVSLSTTEFHEGWSKIW